MFVAVQTPPILTSVNIASLFASKDICIKMRDNWYFKSDIPYSIITFANELKAMHMQYADDYEHISNRIKNKTNLPQLNETEFNIAVLAAIKFFNNEDDNITINLLNAYTRGNWKIRSYKIKESPITIYYNGYNHNDSDIEDLYLQCIGKVSQWKIHKLDDVNPKDFKLQMLDGVESSELILDDLETGDFHHSIAFKLDCEESELVSYAFITSHDEITNIGFQYCRMPAYIPESDE